MLLYHYTNSNGLLGMLQNTSLENPFMTMWATFYRFLNDPNEYQLGVNLIDKYLSVVEDELGIEPKERIDIAKKILEEKTDISKINDLIVNSNKISGLAQYYISFSQHKDSLPLWSMYASNGQGLCLELDSDKIENCNFESMKYFEEKDFEDDSAKELTKRIYTIVNKWSKDSPTTIGDGVNAQFFNDVSRCYFMLSHMYNLIGSNMKYNTYEFESEYRLKVQEFEQVLFRESNGLIIPYVEKQIPIDAISKIIVGPTLDFERTKVSIQMFLASKCGVENSHNITIEQSYINYRG